MRIRRLRDRLALLLAGALGLAGLTAVPAAADDPVEIHGLKGDYYTQSAPGAFDFHELKATGFDPNLDFDNLESRLKSATGQDNDVSVRWTGQIVPEKTGLTTFSVIGDNGFRLWIDGELAIDHWVDDWDREQTAEPVDLTAGQAYDFRLEYFEHYGGSNLHLRWTEPGGSKVAVPQSAFRLPDGYDYDGAVATTVLADGRTLRLDFAHDLLAPPATVTDHLEAVIGGAKWPLSAAELDPADPKALLVTLKEPVVGNKTGTARGTADVRYDGQGGLATARQGDRRLLEQRPQPLHVRTAHPLGRRGRTGQRAPRVPQAPTDPRRLAEPQRALAVRRGHGGRAAAGRPEPG